MEGYDEIRLVLDVLVQAVKEGAPGLNEWVRLAHFELMAKMRS